MYVLNKEFFSLILHLTSSYLTSTYYFEVKRSFCFFS
nr:MAG TPA: hypothetical protein [Bacteriophage sp.]